MATTEREFQIERRRRAWWLFVLRRVRGMNQSGVAQALGMSVNSASTIGDWERGVADPSIRQLHDLAVLYGVTLAFIKSPPETDEERAAEQLGIDLYDDDPAAESRPAEAMG